MVAPIERIYELALRALDEQERRVDDARGSVPTVIAAAGLGLSLLVGPAFDGDHPRGIVEIVAVALGMLGAATVVVAAVLLMRPAGMAFTVDTGQLINVLDDAGVTDAALYEATTDALARRRSQNEPIAARLLTVLDVAFLAVGIELIGFGSAVALAS